MASQAIMERTATAFVKIPASSGKEYVEGFARGVLMAYEHMKEKETQQSEKQPA